MENLIEFSKRNRLTRNFFSLRISFNVVITYIIRGFLDHIVLVILGTDDIKEGGDLRFLIHMVFKKRIPHAFFYRCRVRNVRNEVLASE